MQSSKVILYGLLIGSLLVGCNQWKGTKIQGDKQAGIKRLIVTNSDALEMLIGLGAAENIAGISDTKMKSFIEKTKNWPLIGNWRNPNIEAIINLKPDIAVTYKNWPEPVGFDDKLRPFNISVERMDCYRISEYHSDIYRLASFVDKENAADTIIKDFDKIVGMIKSTVTGVDVKKRVYFEFSDFSAMGPGTGSDEILTLINAINIASKLEIQYPKISTEWLLKENPDVIIKTITADTITEEMYQRIITRAGWNKLNAVRNNKVYLISSELCSGPRAMIGSLYIGKWCYPERFESIDPDSVHLYWLKKYCGVESLEKFVFSPAI